MFAAEDLLDELGPTGGGGLAPTPAGPASGEGAWRSDVALEMWIDPSARPVAIRLAGVLDAATGVNLVHVVEDCLREGHRRFALDTAGLRVAVSGQTVLEQLTARVHHAGGDLQLDRATR